MVVRWQHMSRWAASGSLWRQWSPATSRMLDTQGATRWFHGIGGCLWKSLGNWWKSDMMSCQTCFFFRTFGNTTFWDFKKTQMITNYHDSQKKHYLLEHHGIWKNIDNCQIIFFRCLSYLFLKIMADMFQKTKRVSFSILRPHCERWWWPERYGYCQIVTRLKSLKSPTCISSNVFLKMFYDVLWYCFYCLLLIIICVFDVSWCFMMFHDVSRCFMMFHDVLWCFMMFISDNPIKPSLTHRSWPYIEFSLVCRIIHFLQVGYTVVG